MESDLIIAIIDDDLKLATKSLNQGADVNVRYEEDQTALHKASLWNRLEIMRLLLDYGADINAQDEDDKTALHWSSKYNFFDGVRLLLAHGADVTVRDDAARLVRDYPKLSSEILQLIIDYE